MLTSTRARPRAKTAYRPFVVRVASVRQLSPTFVRVTFTGDDLDEMAPKCLDRRIKLMLPLDGVGISDLGAGEDWYSAWRALPDAVRNPLRTYTARAVRQELAELDIDFVSHGVAGPASAWLTRARPGDEIAIIGADDAVENNDVGIEWRPGAANTVLLGGDETAAPAICSILSSLDAGATGHAFIEVPTAADILEVEHPENVRVTWLARNGDPHGSRLTPAVRAWVRAAVPIASAAPGDPEDVDLKEIDLDRDLVWEASAQVDGATLYAWLAGEANVMRSLRRFLVRGAGIDRRQVAFMGYWRLGHAERA